MQGNTNVKFSNSYFVSDTKVPYRITMNFLWTLIAINLSKLSILLHFLYILLLVNKFQQFLSSL